MIKLDIYTTTEGLEILCSMLSDIGHDSLMIEDSADFENFLEGKYGAWDYVDYELMKRKDKETTVTLHLPGCKNEQENISEIKKLLTTLKATDSTEKFGRLELTIENLPDENWEKAWQKNYVPIKTGEKLLICPPWKIPEGTDRIALIIDPGMAFGTGIDETTRLCLEVLESAVGENSTVLDIGCGSGILAIGALLLGAVSALGMDIAPDAIASAQKNAEINGVSDNAKFICANFADYTEKQNATYDIICANISADTIINLASSFTGHLKHECLLILSGIIKEREQEVTDMIHKQGFVFKEQKEENGWVCIVFMYNITAE